jgi:uncharacterized membrane protein
VKILKLIFITAGIYFPQEHAESNFELKTVHHDRLHVLPIPIIFGNIRRLAPRVEKK